MLQSAWRGNFVIFSEEAAFRFSEIGGNQSVLSKAEKQRVNLAFGEIRVPGSF